MDSIDFKLVLMQLDPYVNTENESTGRYNMIGITIKQELTSL